MKNLPFDQAHSAQARFLAVKWLVGSPLKVEFDFVILTSLKGLSITTSQWEVLIHYLVSSWYYQLQIFKFRTVKVFSSIPDHGEDPRRIWLINFLCLLSVWQSLSMKSIRLDWIRKLFKSAAYKCLMICFGCGCFWSKKLSSKASFWLRWWHNYW